MDIRNYILVLLDSLSNYCCRYVPCSAIEICKYSAQVFHVFSQWFRYWILHIIRSIIALNVLSWNWWWSHHIPMNAFNTQNSKSAKSWFLQIWTYLTTEEIFLCMKMMQNLNISYFMGSKDTSKCGISKYTFYKLFQAKWKLFRAFFMMTIQNDIFHLKFHSKMAK